MNIETANRLAELRKKMGYSQEELADRLGVSRQAVSKWERSEASPDTDNLIALAKLYGISLDDLLNSEKPLDDLVKDKKETIEPEVMSHDEVHIDRSGIHVKDEDGSTVDIGPSGIHVYDGDTHFQQDKEWVKKTKRHTLWLVLRSALPLLGGIAYILVGCFWNSPSGIGWAWGWTLILDAICLGSIFEAILTKRFCAFCFPLLVTSIYVGCGILGNYYGWQYAWHPTWVLFLLIPIFYSVFGEIDHHNHQASLHPFANEEKDD